MARKIKLDQEFITAKTRLPDVVRCKDGTSFNPNSNVWLIGSSKEGMAWIDDEVELKFRHAARQACMRSALKYKKLSFRRQRNHIKDFLTDPQWEISEESCIKFVGNYLHSRRTYARDALITLLSVLENGGYDSRSFMMSEVREIKEAIKRLDFSKQKKYSGPDYMSPNPNEGAFTDTEIQALMKAATQAVIKPYERPENINHEKNERKAIESLNVIWEKYKCMPPSSVDGKKNPEYKRIQSLRLARVGGNSKAIFYPSLLEQLWSKTFFPSVDEKEQKLIESLNVIWEKYKCMPPSSVDGKSNPEYAKIRHLKKAKEGIGEKKFYPSLLEQPWSDIFFPALIKPYRRVKGKFYKEKEKALIKSLNVIWEKYKDMPPSWIDGKTNPDYQKIRGLIKARAGIGERIFFSSLLEQPWSDVFFPPLDPVSSDSNVDKPEQEIEVKTVISFEDYAALILLMRSGRRHNQLAALKFKDLRAEKDFIRKLEIPRCKDGHPPREKSRPVKITEPALWKLLENLKLNVLAYVEKTLNRKFPKNLVAELPFWIDIDWLDGGMTDHQIESDLKDLTAHLDPFCFSNRIYNLGKKLRVPSERNVEFLHITPQRLRKTFCSKLVRKKVHPAVGAYLMDHLSTKTMKSYVKPADLAELLKLTIELMAPIGRAFAGKPVKDELDAINGSNPLSRRYDDQYETIGNCSASDLGEFCQPLDCFTCGFLQPRLNGKYEAIRERVVALINEYQAEGYPETVTIPLASALQGIDAIIVDCKKVKEGVSNVED